MDIHNIHALLFDMDGVVIDTHASVEYFWNQLADKYNVTLTDIDYERFIHGTQAHTTLDRYFPMLTSHDKNIIAKEIVIYEDELTYTLMSGVLDLLSSLKVHGIPTALVTSGSQRKVDAVFSQVPLSDKFDALITAESVQRGKPDPACYRLAAQNLSIDPQHCIVFEDSMSGTQAALGAGATVIGVGKTNILIDKGATQVIPNFEDVTMQRLNTGALRLQLATDLFVNLGKNQIYKG